MKMRTLYISDLDGTLLNPEKEVSEYTKKVIHAFTAAGGCFSAATARSAASAVKILSGLNLDMPAVLMNGAVVFDLSSGSYVKTERISNEDVHHILGVLKDHGIYGFMYCLDGNSLITYYENIESRVLRNFHDERVHKYYKSFEKVSSFRDKVHTSPIIYFALLDHYDRLHAAYQCLEGRPDIGMVLYRDIYEENNWYLEIYSARASKYNAVNYLREQYHFDKIIGFGDNRNDIPLLKACDEFYAVSNAVDELKELATGIIGSNADDGVARFLSERERISV